MPESIDVNHAFDPELRQAQADMDAYAQTRAFEDANGKLRTPNGQFTSANKQSELADSYREAQLDSTTTPYEEMSLTELADKWAEAESFEDKTTVDDVMDVVLSKIENKYGKQEKPDEFESTQDRVLDRFLKLKDLKLEARTGLVADKPEGGKKAPYDWAADDKDGVKSLDELSPEELEVELDNMIGEYRESMINTDLSKDELYGLRKELIAVFEMLAQKYGWDHDEENKRQRKLFEYMGLNPRNKPEEDFDFTPKWDRDADSDEVFLGDEVVSADELISQHEKVIKPRIRDRLRNRWNSIKVRAGLLANGDAKGAIGTANSEAERKKTNKLLIGATALAMIGITAVLVKRGDIDLIPTRWDGDGAGFDLFGIKVGDGTNAHNALAADLSTPPVEQAAPKIEYSENAPSDFTIEELGQSAPGNRADTISDHALTNLIRTGNSQPSQAQILAETQRILDLNNLDWEQARNISAGTEIKI